MVPVLGFQRFGGLGGLVPLDGPALGPDDLCGLRVDRGGLAGSSGAFGGTGCRLAGDPGPLARKVPPVRCASQLGPVRSILTPAMWTADWVVGMAVWVLG